MSKVVKTTTTLHSKKSNFAAGFERKGIKEKFDKRKLQRKPSHAKLKLRLV
jgi:hypothetical protein